MPSNLPATAMSVDRLLRNATDGVFVLDRDRQFVLFNEACERITGYKAPELVGNECLCTQALNCHDEHGRPLAATLCPVKSLFEGSADSARQRMQIRRKDGSTVWVETVYTPVHNGAGAVESVLGVMRDVSEVKCKEDGLMEELAALRQQLENGNGKPRPGMAPASGSTTVHSEGTSDPADKLAESDEASRRERALLLDPALAHVERQTIRRALQAANWQRNKAARFMGISRSRLYRRMEALGIDPNVHA